MKVFDAIKKRRAVKHYDADHKLTEQELRALLSAAALAPTSLTKGARDEENITELP